MSGPAGDRPQGRSALPRLLRTRLLHVAGVRLASLYVALFAASALVLGVTVFLQTRSALQRQLAARIETETAFLRSEFLHGGLGHLRSIIAERGRSAGALDYLLEDRSGARLAGEIPARAALPLGWTTFDVPKSADEADGPERVRALVSDLGGDTRLAVGDDLGGLTEVQEAIVTALLWTVGLAALLGIGGGVLLSSTFLSRVDAIAGTAEAIIGGDMARRIPLRETDDDLDRLAGTLNRMLDRIMVLMDSLRQVSSDVAHDLRTPLSRLMLRLQDARVNARTTAQYDAAVDAALVEAEGLLATFSALLRIAQVEGAARKQGFCDVDLSALAETVADAYRPDLEEAGHRLLTRITPGVHVQGDRELLTQALANLVENALRHTPVGTRTTVELSAGPQGLCTGGPCLAVADDGPGVAAADLPRLARRFYRGERSRTTPGNGLGLSLVNAVAELHGAALGIESAPSGLRVALAFSPPTGLSGAPHA